MLAQTKLTGLRTRLAELRRKRQTLRWATGWTGWAAAMLAVLLAVFLVDIALEMGRLERCLSLAACLGTAVAAWKYLLKPYLGFRETDLDMALLVESRLKLDSDLVAALQFEEAEAQRWGSGQLRAAVIDYVAEFGNGVNVLEGLPVRSLRRRTTALILLVVLATPFAVRFPKHIPIFLQRLVLSSAHYPTQTQIVAVTANEIAIDLSKPIRRPYGKPVTFAVQTAGETPQLGELRLTPRSANSSGFSRLLRAISDWSFAGSAPYPDPLSATIDLRPRPATTGKGSAESMIFAGVTPPLTDAVSVQFFIGDAWTDPQTLEVTPLPVVTLELTAVMPEYARRSNLAPKQLAGSQVVSVIDGSQVQLKLSCTNKNLAKATLTVGGEQIALVAGSDARSFSLPEKVAAFREVTEPFSFSVQVEDEDGLALERPLVGHVRLHADREPRVTAAVVTERVQPNAQPTIAYKATDDFGLAEVKLHFEILRADGTTEQKAGESIKVQAADQPVTLLPLEPVGLKVPLAPLKLAKGDMVRVTVEAVDYRGATPGKSASSEPVVFQVTDIGGILEGLTESDQKSAKQLDVILQRQLGIGEAP